MSPKPLMQFSKAEKKFEMAWEEIIDPVGFGR